MLAVSSNVFGDTTTTTTTTTAKKGKDKPFYFKAGMPLDESDNMPDPKTMMYTAAYVAPAAIKVDNSWDIDVNGSFTYWYASQDGMDIANIIPTESAGGGLPGAVVYQSFGYTPGFKAGIGIDTGFDNWTLDAEYTWYDHTRTTPLTTAASVAPPATFFSGVNAWNPSWGGVVNTVASSWKLNFNMLDLTAGRPFYQGKKVVLAPSGGLRFLWIKQALTVNGTGLTVFSAHNSTASSSSWAVGPKIGVDSHWMLGGGFRFDGMIGSSLLYTKYTNISIGNSTPVIVVGGVTTATSDTTTTTNYGALRPTMDLGLGLGYGMYCFDNGFYFDLAVRYDFMQFWSQNMMRAYKTQVYSAGNAAIGDLRLHGLTVTLRCDF
jgi:hypothetical protein